MNQIDTLRLAQIINEGYNIIDLRPIDQLESGFIKSSLAVKAGHRKLAEWVGHHLYYPVDKTVFITSSPDDHIAPVCEVTGIPVQSPEFIWQDPSSLVAAGIALDMLIPVSPDEFVLDAKHDKTIEIVDLRDASAYAAAHLKKSIHLEWVLAGAMIQEYERNDKIYLLSPDAAISWSIGTLLRFNGFNFVRPVVATLAQLEELGLSVVHQKKKQV